MLKSGHIPQPVTLDAQGLPSGYAFKPDYELTPRQVRQLMDAQEGKATGPKVVVVDCRLPDENRVARIEGATLIPLQEMERRVDDLKDLVSDAGPGATLVIHCHHGMRSMKAALMLRAHGVQAMSMAAGIDAWSLAVDAKVPRY